ncbi:MAG TPA: Ig-like domain-containing protein [Candidatus Cloacimonadota bacterium]|nr:Ig-like domain-containing protein [Candidatus Cloacimonadota bacterium]HPT71373.1 Ig-like domain-containing protein [Candidatus Cloacimonadota bacterium]
MKKVFNLLFITFFLFILVGCGHRQGPTGGKSDTEKIRILAVTPDEFTDLKDGQIDITFSKMLDRTKVPTGIYIYPPIDRKRFKYQGNHLVIRILEPLKPNTNYYFTFTPRIQDERGNSLEETKTIVYANGTLQTARISGDFKLEDPSDSKYPVNLTLLDADTLMVFNQNIKAPNYALENLNQQSYILRAYIDKNVNGKYDFGDEPYAEELSPKSPISTVNLNLVYSDTTKVVLKSASVISNREMELTLSEPVKSYADIHITAKEGSVSLPIELTKLDGNKLTLLTAGQDTLKYKVSMEGIIDHKDNLTKESHLYFSGVARVDKTAPTIVATYPRNGTSINSLTPELKVVFSEIIPDNNIKYTLIDTETNSQIPLKIVSGNDRTYIFKPMKTLVNYRSYKFIISRITSDISSNALGKDYEFLFLTLVKNGG